MHTQESAGIEEFGRVAQTLANEALHVSPPPRLVFFGANPNWLVAVWRGRLDEPRQRYGRFVVRQWRNLTTSGQLPPPRVDRVPHTSMLNRDGREVMGLRPPEYSTRHQVVLVISAGRTVLDGHELRPLEIPDSLRTTGAETTHNHPLATTMTSEPAPTNVMQTAA